MNLAIFGIIQYVVFCHIHFGKFRHNFILGDIQNKLGGGQGVEQLGSGQGVERLGGGQGAKQHQNIV